MYTDIDQSYWYSRSRLRFDDTKVKQAMTMENWPEFQSKRGHVDHTNKNKNKNKNKKKRKDLWSEAPPVTFHGYQKWLKDVENEVNKVETRHKKKRTHKQSTTGKMVDTNDDNSNDNNNGRRNSKPGRKARNKTAPIATATVIDLDDAKEPSAE